MKDTFNILDQLVKLLDQLQNFRSISALCDSLNRSDRNVYRYIKALEEMGFVFERKTTNRSVQYKIESIPEEFTIRINAMSEIINSQS